MTLTTKMFFLKYIAQALKFLKDRKICHLDLKPSNILFASKHIKISDFG
jgi:serine/threonine protein kinase